MKNYGPLAKSSGSHPDFHTPHPVQDGYPYCSISSRRQTGMKKLLKLEPGRIVDVFPAHLVFPRRWKNIKRYMRLWPIPLTYTESPSRLVFENRKSLR